MDDDTRLEAAVLAAPGAVHDEIGAERFDAADLRVELYTDSDVPRALYQQADEIRVKAFERPGASVEDRRVHSSAGGNVGELERDVPAPHEHDARRQPIEVQEVLARREPLGAGESERRGHGARRDEDAPSRQPIIADRQRRRAHEAGPTVELLDAHLRPRLLGALGCRIDQ